jgi:signal transduction histidine kinase
MKKTEELSDSTKKAITICESQVNRINEITRNLGHFSRISKELSTMSDLNKVIGRVLTLYEPQFKEDNIKTDIQFHPDLPQIPIDQGKIEQVIFNLISNANAAMEGQENKILRIITKPATSKDHVQVIISDNGAGIDSSDIDKIFEPYFTTKNNPQETGMGLFISHTIIQDHGGRLWAENNEWGGASFIIEFPVVKNMHS